MLDCGMNNSPFRTVFTSRAHLWWLHRQLVW